MSYMGKGYSLDLINISLPQIGIDLHHIARGAKEKWNSLKYEFGNDRSSPITECELQTNHGVSEDYHVGYFLLDNSVLMRKSKL